MKYISSYLPTTKLDTKKSKAKSKKQTRVFMVSKLFSNVIDKSYSENLLQWWINNALNLKIKKLRMIETKWTI